MEHSVWLIGLLIAAWGIVSVLWPFGQKALLGFLAQGRRAYAAVALKILIGVLWLLFARDCRIPSVIIVLGILTVLGTVLFAALPLSKVQAWVQWCYSRPIWFYRVWGVFAVLMGVLVIYAGWPVS